MELGAFWGAALDRMVREIAPVDRGREPGEDLGNSEGNWSWSWWSRVTVAGICWGYREETGPSEGSGRAIAQSWMTGNEGNGGSQKRWLRP